MSSIIKLNVGGHYFTTSLQTLTKDPNSMLAAMFSGKFDTKPAEDGAFFIDRDGTHFRFILNYLRTGKLTLPGGGTFIEEFKEEAEFYQIQGLVKEFNNSVRSERFTTVKLNVGGHLFTTSLQTLTKDPNSMLAAMFSGNFEIKTAEDGAFFIDRDGTHFRFILNYLRNGELILPEGATFLKEIEAEATFYQIQGILDEFRLISEILTNEEHRSLLLSWLPCDVPDRRHRLRLLFRASRDGFSAKTFHSKCDNKGPTITIIQSGDNIFGGFTEKSWNSNAAGIACSQAFLFSMVNPHGLGPTRMPFKCQNDEYAIWCGIDGPSFEIDLDISDSENLSASGSSYLGAVYECPPQQNNAFFTGQNDFVVTNYEVFGFLN